MSEHQHRQLRTIMGRAGPDPESWVAGFLGKEKEAKVLATSVTFSDVAEVLARMTTELAFTVREGGKRVAKRLVVERGEVWIDIHIPQVMQRVFGSLQSTFGAGEVVVTRRVPVVRFSSRMRPGDRPFHRPALTDELVTTHGFRVIIGEGDLPFRATALAAVLAGLFATNVGPDEFPCLLLSSSFRANVLVSDTVPPAPEGAEMDILYAAGHLAFLSQFWHRPDAAGSGLRTEPGSLFRALSGLCTRPKSACLKSNPTRLSVSVAFQDEGMEDEVLHMTLKNVGETWSVQCDDEFVSELIRARIVEFDEEDDGFMGGGDDAEHTVVDPEVAIGHFVAFLKGTNRRRGRAAGFECRIRVPAGHPRVSFRKPTAAPAVAGYPDGRLPPLWSSPFMFAHTAATFPWMTFPELEAEIDKVSSALGEPARTQVINPKTCKPAPWVLGFRGSLAEAAPAPFHSDFSSVPNSGFHAGIRAQLPGHKGTRTSGADGPSAKKRR